MAMQQAWKKEEAPLECVDLRIIGVEHPTSILPALQFQHQFFLHEMQGALLPAPVALSGNEVLLDFPSGSGSWCLDASHRYPRAQVWGVDTQQALIDLALEDAAQRGSRHLHFQGIQNPRVLPFADATFDVIHLQQCTSLFSLRQWPHLLAEMNRLLKPGGWLTLIDFEIGFASGPAVDRLLTCFGHILAKMGRSIALDGKLPITGSVLGPGRMAQFGFTEIGYHLFPVDLGGWNNLAGRTYLAQCVIRPEMIADLAVRTGIGTPEDVRLLVWETQRELYHMSFCGAGILLSSFGRKPWPSAPGAGHHPT